ncbi:hypothetical protein PUR61_05340 [Streptomyces sp. BE20]|uniref:hypothetical protein n=1 Tax=Streptomyces sp. BE20 TaxID=3002525 RepID=UPI002E7878A0|nr:hypothetical protein [Streptomyces sp. BE20]MEE1821622.1 hypothetical protein [Streptomyces sp. BE20]
MSAVDGWPGIGAPWVRGTVRPGQRGTGRAAGHPAAIGELGRALTAAAQDRPLPDWAAGAGRTEDVRRRRARQALLEAIARHHHGPLPDQEPDDRPW